MASANRNDSLRQAFAGRLAAAFKQAGWRVKRDVSGMGSVDLLCESGEQTYAVVVNAQAGAGRIGALRGLLADSVLRARATAEERSVSPLAVVAASALSDAMLEQLRSYHDAFAPDVAWGAMDLRGLFELHRRGLDHVRERTSDGTPEVVGNIGAVIGGLTSSARAVVGERTIPPNAFTDLGQWATKVLLAPRIDAAYLEAPRQPVRGVRSLAEHAKVSVFSASRLLKALRELDCLEASSEGPRLVRLYHLLEVWRAAVSRAPEERGARFPLPVRDREEELGRLLARQGAAVAGSRSCLALFSASRALGLGWVRGARSHAYCEDLSDSGLQRLGLCPSLDLRDADVVLRRPRFPEALFRGRVDRAGVPVADGLQCWLDLVHHPARGEEQASEILRRLGLDEEQADV